MCPQTLISCKLKSNLKYQRDGYTHKLHHLPLNVKMKWAMSNASMINIYMSILTVVVNVICNNWAHLTKNAANSSSQIYVYIYIYIYIHRVSFVSFFILDPSSVVQLGKFPTFVTLHIYLSHGYIAEYIMIIVQMANIVGDAWGTECYGKTTDVHICLQNTLYSVVNNY